MYTLKNLNKTFLLVSDICSRQFTTYVYYFYNTLVLFTNISVAFLSKNYNFNYLNNQFNSYCRGKYDQDMFLKSVERMFTECRRYQSI